MNRKLKTLFLLLCSTTAFSITLISCDLVESKKEQIKNKSYERKMVQFKKTAEEFKATLGPNDKIITERIDSVAQKVFYAIDDEGDGHYENIKMHDYSTGETKSILPESGKIGDFEFCGTSYIDSKLIGDRLFFQIISDCMKDDNHGVFYIDVRDNSMHYVEKCSYANYEGPEGIIIHKYCYLGEDEYGHTIVEDNDYSLSTSLSDEAYADNRWEQKRKEERLAEEWRKRDIERILEFDYTVQPWPNKPTIVDNISTLHNGGWQEMGRVYHNAITIPKNKVWVLKRFSYSGYDQYHTPLVSYHKISNAGSFNIYGSLVENAQVFYSGSYIFSIYAIGDEDRPGRRTATIKFSEEAY